jgi:hypothetical protein
MIFYKTIYLSQICNEYNFQKYFVQYIMGNQNYCSWKHKVVDPYVFNKVPLAHAVFSWSE